ncbi:sensor domain-containing diguanylate cyclase [Acidovorax sp. Leaf160]|uniref:sensor domain-containing diguanylate cyclase n=1 Tax=Acidovorax sp. Leaf160 TaxID=1736280 RepID=UPI0009E8C44D|nr:sensor domain-containing diguanylate cyclase [Acidovorax sp. Leaf160]
MITTEVFAVSGPWRNFLTLIAFAISIFLGWLVASGFEREVRRAEEVRTGEIAVITAASVEKVIERAMSATRSLAVMVYQGNGKVEDFESLARFLIPLYKGAYALSLAPNAIIRQVEPLDKNLIVRGHDLLEHLNREEVIRNLDPQNTKVEFVGPIKLVQGPMGAIGMLPVFLTDANGRSHFWGYTVVTLKFPDALQEANVRDIVGEGYAYELTGTDPETGGFHKLLHSDEPVLDGECREVKSGTASWAFCVSRLPRSSDNARFYFDLSLIFLASLAMARLSYSFLGRYEKGLETRRQALRDPLTDLPNRRLMVERLQEAQQRCKMQNGYFALALLDLDGFKSINDRLGHAQGDAVLVTTAHRLSQQIGAKDTLARLGGDEFVLIIQDLHDMAECQTLMERLLQTVRAPIELRGGIGQVHASIGVVFCSSADALAGGDLLHLADTAMYQAKNDGKNRCVFVTPK